MLKTNLVLNLNFDIYIYIYIYIILLILGIVGAIYFFSIMNRSFDYTNEKFLQGMFSNKKLSRLNQNQKENVQKSRKFLVLFVVFCIVFIVALNSLILHSA